MSVQVKGSGTIGGLDEGLVVSGIVTSSTQINVGSNIKIGSAGVCTATSFVGSGANLTSLPAQVTLSNNADNRVITGGSGVNLNGEATFTYDGTSVATIDTSQTYATFRLDGSAGGAIEFYENGTRRFELYGTDPEVALYDRDKGAYHTRFKAGGNVELSDGNLVLASGHGIDFSATANGSGTMENELLDDYEEGTWVPSFANVNTPTYGHRSGRYTKIGRFVYLVCQITVDSGLDTSDGSTVNIGGFPFSGNSAHESCNFTFGRYTNLLSDSKLDDFTNVRFIGTAVLLLEGNNADISYAECNSSGTLQFACSYAL